MSTGVAATVQLVVGGVLGVGDEGVLPLTLVLGVVDHGGAPHSLELGVVNLVLCNGGMVV